MNGLAIALCALLGAVEFPMTSTGRLGVFKFFSSDVEHFVFSEIAARVTALRAGDFETRLGLEMDTYMGESWNNPDMKFNIYGGHWNISFELAWLTGWGEARLYTDHECFHNIDMEDTLSEYMNNVKLGAVYYPDSFGQPDRPQSLRMAFAGALSPSRRRLPEGPRLRLVDPGAGRHAPGRLAPLVGRAPVPARALLPQ
jgi:hypothetical protein